MASIEKKEIETAYELGKLIDRKQLSLSDAVDRLAHETGMAASSAQMYLQAVTCMLKGEIFKRSINFEAAKYFLEKISEDFGEVALEKARTALREHVDYYDSLGSGKKIKQRQLTESGNVWIFQGNPSENNIDEYLTTAGYVYWSVKQDNYKSEMKVGDKAFIWRGKGKSKGAYGIVAIGTVEEAPTDIDSVQYPDLLYGNIWSKELGYRTRAGIRLEEIRLTEKDGMISSERFDRIDSLARMQLRTARQGSTFKISPEQYYEIVNMWQSPSNIKDKENKDMFTAKSLNAYFDVIQTKYHAMAHRGRFLEFWSEYSRSDSRFLIGYKQLSDGLKTLADSQRSLADFQTNHEKTWRDMSQIQGDNPVFQSFLTVQTSAIFHLISQIVQWANGDGASSYKDKEVSLTNERLQKTVFALNQLHIEGHAENSEVQIKSSSIAENTIVYGAPGAGKSYFVNQKTSGFEPIRTVFHPEYQNSDFVGGLRPSLNEKGEITYAYNPGPFIDALIKADANPDNHVFLIIEEINRANAAAVFGDVFQLLDRKPDGTSEYTTNTDPALERFLREKSYSNPEKLSIPSNLSLLATMNSSDQGVFLMDTAFKRRWEFHYCPIDFTQHSDKPSFTDAIIEYNGSKYSWMDFATAINNELKKKDIEEDRLIGTYFLTENERRDSNSCKKAIAGKLLIYLWDDVLRHGLRHEIFLQSHTTFSDLVNAFEKGNPLFSSKLEQSLKEVARTPAELQLDSIGQAAE